MPRMRIGLAQINATVGDLAGNAARVLDMAREAADVGCRLLLTPELVLTGYPPQDLLFKPHFITDQLAQLHGMLAPALPLPALVGFVDRDGEGKLYNAAAYVEQGQVRQVVHKTLLPTYDVFDEWRYFRPRRSIAPVHVRAHAHRRDDLRGHLGRRAMSATSCRSWRKPGRGMHRQPVELAVPSGQAWRAARRLPPPRPGARPARAVLQPRRARRTS